MIQYLILALINALIIQGWYWAAHFEWNEDYHRTASDYKKAKESDVNEESKMIFWRVRFYALKWLGPYWSKPVITCPICMASLHSTYVYAFMNGCSTFVEFVLYAGYILMLAGLNAIIIQFYKD